MKYIVKFVCCMLLVCNSLYSMGIYSENGEFKIEIEQTRSMQAVLNTIEQLHNAEVKNVCVFLDLDQTLVNPVDLCLHPDHWHFFHSKLENRFEQCEDAFKELHTFGFLDGEIYCQAKDCVTDPLVPQIIKKIKEYKFKAFIITSAQYGIIEYHDKTMQEVRMEHLNSALNMFRYSERVEFGPFFTNDEESSLTNHFNGEADKPLYHNGAMFCRNGVKKITKCDVVENVLDFVYEKFGYLPECALVVDNYGKNVADMVTGFYNFSQKIDKNKEIKFYAYEYVLWNDVPPIDEDKLNRHLDQFFKSGVWNTYIE